MKYIKEKDKITSFLSVVEYKPGKKNVEVLYGKRDNQKTFTSTKQFDVAFEGEKYSKA